MIAPSLVGCTSVEGDVKGKIAIDRTGVEGDVSSVIDGDEHQARVSRGDFEDAAGFDIGVNILTCIFKMLTMLGGSVKVTTECLDVALFL